MSAKAKKIAAKIQKLLGELARECTWDVDDGRGNRTINPERQAALDELVCIESTVLYMIKGFRVEEYLDTRVRMSQPAKYLEDER